MPFLPSPPFPIPALGAILMLVGLGVCGLAFLAYINLQNQPTNCPIKLCHLTHHTTNITFDIEALVNEISYPAPTIINPSSDA